jgi:hypothetical protein
MKPSKCFVKGLQPCRKDPTGAQVVSIAEATGDGQKLEGIERFGTFEDTVDVGRLGVGPSKLPGRDGLLIAIRARSPKDNCAGQGHGSTGKEANRRKNTG